MQNALYQRIRVWFCVPLAAGIWLSTGTVCRAWGLLDAFRKEVRGDADRSDNEDPPPRPSKSSDNGRSGSGITLNEGDASALGALVVCTVLAPFYIPHALLDDDFAVEAWFQRFPYDIDVGHMAVGDPEAANGKFMAARVSAEYGSNLGHVSWVGGKALVSAPLRMGLDTQFTHYQEQLPCGCHDNFWVGDFNLVYRFAQSNWAEFRAGAGVNWFDDRNGDRYGVNFTYGWDVTALKPFVWSTEFDLVLKQASHRGSVLGYLCA